MTLQAEAPATFRQGNAILERNEHGTYFHQETPQKVRTILENARRMRQRIRIWLGDTATGIAWPEEHDVLGYVGRSMGPIKVPLLIHNARSHGGGAILDHCIVAIADRPKALLYGHPNLSLGDWTVGPPPGGISAL